jgi:hypothetical protein
MKTLKYSITIDKPVNVVFDTIQDKSVYADWAKPWGEGMTYEGEWKEGSHLSFFDTSGQGTKALVKEVIQNVSIKMEHTTMVENRNKEVTDLDETMQKWIGSQEEYHFKAIDDETTELTIIIEADEAFEPMMQAWNQALKYFKDICEAV